MRQQQINKIKKSKNLPVLVFTHPKDPYDGLLSDWVEEIPGVKRIVISEDKKIIYLTAYIDQLNFFSYFNEGYSDAKIFSGLYQFWISLN